MPSPARPTPFQRLVPPGAPVAGGAGALGQVHAPAGHRGGPRLPALAAAAHHHRAQEAVRPLTVALGRQGLPQAARRRCAPPSPHAPHLRGPPLQRPRPVLPEEGRHERPCPRCAGVAWCIAGAGRSQRLVARAWAAGRGGGEAGRAGWRAAAVVTLVPPAAWLAGLVWPHGLPVRHAAVCTGDGAGRGEVGVDGRAGDGHDRRAAGLAV